MSFFEVLGERGEYFLLTLLGGWPTTVTVAAGALIFALLFGLVIALLRMSRWRLLRVPAVAYIEFFRGTPLLVQLFVIYFGLPDAGIEPTPFQAAIIGMGLNGAAYLAEIYRAGIEAIHRGQMEAALSLGMTTARAMKYRPTNTSRISKPTMAAFISFDRHNCQRSSASTLSRVVPGRLLTIDRSSRSNRLSSDDFPTFGRPTMATATSGDSTGLAGSTACGSSLTTSSSRSPVPSPCSAAISTTGSNPSR